MPANLTIYIGTVNSSGVRVPLVGAKVYLRPSRTDITYLNGVNYLPWDVNQTSDPGYRDCWVATTNGAGYATFQSVPFTDTEMHRPKDPITGAFIGPAIEWQLINPNGPSTSGAPSVVVYSGKLLSTMVLLSPVNVPDDVMSLSVDAWRVSQMAYTANPVGGGWQSGSITFGVGGWQFFGSCGGSRFKRRGAGHCVKRDDSGCRRAYVASQHPLPRDGSLACVCYLHYWCCSLPRRLQVKT